MFEAGAIASGTKSLVALHGCDATNPLVRTVQVEPAEEAIDFVLHVIETQRNDGQGVKPLDLQGKNQAFDELAL